MLTRKLPGFEPGSRLSQLSQQAAGQLKRVPLPWWQTAVALLLLVVLANSLAKLLWTLLPDAKSGPAHTPTIDLQQKAAAASALSGVDINSLTALNLFGKAGEVTVVQPMVIPNADDDIDAEETKLALKLTGVVPSSVASASSAVISHNNKQKSYVPGDKLPGGRQVTLDRVLRDRVIISNNGRYESLWLFDEQGATGSSSNNRATSANRTNIQGARANQRPRPAKPSTSNTRNKPAIELPKEMPTAESLAKVVKFTLHRKGFQVHPGADRAQFDKAGLKAGDVVTHINGTSIQDMNLDKSLYQQFLESRSASFQIIRNGETIDLDVDIDNQ